MSNQDLQTIDPAALAQVSGGATATATTSTDDQLVTALTGILNSIHSLATQNNNGINPQEMMLFMMMLNQRNQQNAAAAAALGGSYPWPPPQPINYY